MENEAPPGSPPRASAGAEGRLTLTLRYKSVEALLRDRLTDSARGIIARTGERVAEGEVVDLWIHVASEGIAAAAHATVLWTAPLARGWLVAFDLAAISRRDADQLDRLLGASPGAAGDAGALDAGARRLSVVLLQSNPVLRQVLASALSRFVRERGWRLELETVDGVEAFVTAATGRSRQLAIVDCDGLAATPDSVLDAVRGHERTGRLPVIVLSERQPARAQDRNTVTMRKPVAMKALIHTAGLLLRS